MNHIGCALQFTQFGVEEFSIDLADIQRTHRVNRLRQVKIAVHYYFVIIIGEKNRYIGIPFYDTEQKIYIPAIAVIYTYCGYLFGSIGPNLHTRPLLGGKVTHQRVGKVKKHTHHTQCYQQEYESAVPSYFIDIHTILTFPGH